VDFGTHQQTASVGNNMTFTPLDLLADAAGGIDTAKKKPALAIADPGAIVKLDIWARSIARRRRFNG
jgi:hypothetical protein